MFSTHSFPGVYLRVDGIDADHGGTRPNSETRERLPHIVTGSDVPAWARPESPGFGLDSALKTPKPSLSQAPKSPGFSPSRGFWLVNFRKWGPGLEKFQVEPEPNLSEAGAGQARPKSRGFAASGQSRNITNCQQD
ncbi:hypothetical protein B0H16DRAFT_1453907 [Mycena metata]|uniref:Uncharacterized protein n=1 Tax=Mycena metata TaxID=1033252 RepID=A0AAD7JPT7_9AGAR|nr:hypothetical protein B0H16DRAFT_1453907 [Mycena metata]